MFNLKWNRSYTRPTETSVITVTEVRIEQLEPYYCEMMLELEGDYSQVHEADVVKAALQKHYDTTFKDKADQEKFTSIEEQLQKSIEEINTVKNKVLAEMRTEMDKNRTAILEVGDYIGELMEKVGGEGNSDMGTTENGSVNTN